MKIAKEKGAITVIDGAQSVPHVKTDVGKIGCDFLAFSGHKMLAPFGTGVLYGKRELLERMEPFSFGGGMVSSVSRENADWKETPEKFEAGTMNVSGAVGLAEAIKYLEKIGMEKTEKHVKKLADYVIEKSRETGGTDFYVPEKNQGIISFNLKNLHPHDVASVLDESGISIRAGNHCNMPLMSRLGITGTCRISLYVYNTFDEIDKLFKELNRIKDM